MSIPIAVGAWGPGTRVANTRALLPATRPNSAEDRARRCSGFRPDRRAQGDLHADEAVSPVSPVILGFSLSTVCLLQCRPFVHRDVVAFVTLDFVLRVVLGCAMRIAFVGNVFCVHLDNPSANVSSLRVPGHVITDSEFCRHGGSFPVAA